MKPIGMIQALFGLAALYDGLLGLAFLLAGPRLYEAVQLTPPNHWGYVQFPALLLIVFALMFVAVAWAPHRHANLIPPAIGLKASYCGVVFFHWFGAGLPDLWKPWAVFDLLFLLLFLWAWRHLSTHPAPPAHPQADAEPSSP